MEREKELIIMEDKTLIGYCGYCKTPVCEGEGMICIKGVYYHFDKVNPLYNCYYPEEDEEN